MKKYERIAEVKSTYDLQIKRMQIARIKADAKKKERDNKIH